MQVSESCMAGAQGHADPTILQKNGVLLTSYLGGHYQSCRWQAVLAEFQLVL